MKLGKDMKGLTGSQMRMESRAEEKRPLHHPGRAVQRETARTSGKAGYLWIVDLNCSDFFFVPSCRIRYFRRYVCRLRATQDKEKEQQESSMLARHSPIEQ